jgi:hypothetical protein
MSLLPLLAALCGVLGFGPASAAALESAGGAVSLSRPPVRLAQGPRQRELDGAAAWREFQSRHGRWSAAWNAVTATPHRAVGPSIPLAGNPADSMAVDRGVRALIGSEPGIFGTPTLETVAVQRIGAIWYARYRQTFHGIPVAFAGWEFRVRDGRLVAFGADGPSIPVDAPTHPRLVAAAAREAARSGVPFDALVDRVEGGERLWLVPSGDDSAPSFRLALEAEVITATPPHRWLAYVDALDGRVLWRHDVVRNLISGTVTGGAQLTIPTDPLTTEPFELEAVAVGQTNDTTNANGFYSAAGGSHTKVSSALSGTHCVVTRPNNASASFSTTVSDPATVNIAWGPSNSLDSERDGYYHVNKIYDHVKALDPGFTFNDYAMPCRVEQTGDVCNSWWDGAGINFYAAGGGCPSLGTVPDLIYHEYGHSVNDHVYKQAGDGVGMLNGALHEGMADVMAAFVTDNPVIGDGFYGPGTSLRTLANANRWPEDLSGDPHWTGLIIGGAFWDLRQSLGLATAERLSHFAKYGTPDNPDDGIAMNDYFVETLVADDNDANLANGTPHFAQIDAAFAAHGIGTNFWIGITHSPLTDTAAPGPYAVTATFGYSGPFGALDPASPTLHYSINGGVYTPAPMSPTGNPGEYRAAIPAVSGAIVRYYVSAADTYGGVATEPPGAPAEHVHTFLTGNVATVFLDDMETDPGWTVGAPGDLATTGIWVRAIPVGTNVNGIEVQPSTDHTPDPGVQCFVTGNANPTDPVGTNDVDGGKTTLLTQVFSAAGVPNPAIEFYRWYSNNGGADPGRDIWRVDLSNDGGTSWVPVENTIVTDNSWRRVVFFIADFLPPTAQMQMRFVADDEGPESLVEAAVDDFRLMSFPATTGVADAPGALPLALAAPRPNPFRASTTLRYSLSRAARVTLRIHDLAGRTVRVIDEGSRAAGAHQLDWDGRDDAGREARSGTYFVRLTVDGVSRSQTVVRLR